jgi:hypothetical protein
LVREEAAQKSHLKEKLTDYQKASNARFVYYGLSTFLITIGFYLTNLQPFAALFGVMLVLFSINNPSSRKIVIDLKLKGDEKKAILSDEEII